jgi:magnesium chelatase family protein
MLDRIDMVIDVPQIDFFALDKKRGESSKFVAARVAKAREVQKSRYEKEEKMQDVTKINSKINGEILEKYCELDENNQKLLQNAATKMNISMRGITRILRVARSIADLEGLEKINQNHLLEAISYRRTI